MAERAVCRQGRRVRVRVLWRGFGFLLAVRMRIGAPPFLSAPGLRAETDGPMLRRMWLWWSARMW